MREYGGNSFSSLTVTGDLTVSGNTTTSTNTTITDKLIELANGTTGTPSGDSGIVVERGDSTNAAFVWDESGDTWVAATTAATGASTGDLSLTPTDLNISDLAFTPDGITTSHITTAGSLKIRATDNMHIGDDGADSIRLGRTNTALAKVHIRSGADTDLVVSNSKVGIGTDAPAHTLDVVGDVDISGGLSFDAGTAVTSIDTDLSSVSGSDDTLASAKAVKAYVDSVAGAAVDLTSDVTGTLPVGNGGTGASTLTDGGVLLGSGTGAITASAVLANGELLIGDNSGDPTVATLSAGNGIDITNGAGSITIAAEESSASNKGAVIVAGGTDCTVTYSSGTATVAVDNLGTAKVTSGTFADARIAASNVTQHQASITGTGALNSGSITSGFGNIDVGSSTIDTTGAVGTGNLTAAGDIIATGGDLTLGTSADSADASVKAADESGTDTAGKKLAIQGGLGTGSGASGAVEISVGIPAGSGSSVQSAALAVKVEAAGTSTFYGGTANLANDSGVGEIVTFGTEDGTDTLAAGRLMVLNSSGVWKYADADAEATTINLLAIALGTAVSDGLLVRGYFKLNTYIEGSFAKGAVAYVSETAGSVDFTRPSAAGDFVRVLGHGTDTTGVIAFNPSGNWIEL